jgi:purine/pyrimidine-nucleoside phosphorylase
MLKVNKYFNGHVKSIAFRTAECPATIGVMVPGEYEFGTSTVEFVTVVSGMMTVQLPGETGWENYKPYETFMVEKDRKFKLKIKTDTAYVCLYK